MALFLIQTLPFFILNTGNEVPFLLKNWQKESCYFLNEVPSQNGQFAKEQQKKVAQGFQTDPTDRKLCLTLLQINVLSKLPHGERTREKA